MNQMECEREQPNTGPALKVLHRYMPGGTVESGSRPVGRASDESLRTSSRLFCSVDTVLLASELLTWCLIRKRSIHPGSRAFVR
jgi:hypothetical protein